MLSYICLQTINPGKCIRGKLHMDNIRGRRKGAWTYEEDNLLKACINKYGEGKWNLVPQRAGLNRCRKSCRLRWLNYLNPEINRESFTEDEVDMIIRLHKLLGNRWALIAARLPNRTSNDVKNYWHTHLHKKMILRKLEETKEKEKSKKTIKAHEVIKPRPRNFSSHTHWLNEKHNIIVKPTVTVSTKDGTAVKDRGDTETMVANQTGRDCVDALQPSLANAPTPTAMWWDSLLNLGEQECSEKNGSCSLLQEENFILEFPNVDNFYSDSNLCDFCSVWDL